MWKNWAGNQDSSAEIVSPETLVALRGLLAKSDTVRVIGAGHSFTPLIGGADRLIRLNALDIPTVTDSDSDTAWINANARLHELSEHMAMRNIAFRNLGDINVQSFAGAAATATHGTGQGLNCLSAELMAARIMTAEGDILETDSDESGRLLRACQVSLGVLGVMLEAKVRVQTKYNLRRQVRMRPVAEVLETMHENWAAHRNFEFFYIPHSAKAIEISHDISSDPVGRAPMDLDNLGVKLLKLARSLGRVHPVFRKTLLAVLSMVQSDEDYVGESWRVLCSQRDVRFVEMEYHLPPEQAGDALREVVNRTETKFPDVYFPIEVRQTAGDTAMLSPFQGGNRVSVAVHIDAAEDYQAFFSDLEPVFLAAGGRPHWGKLHSLDANRLSDLYPDFDAFLEIRQQLDPSGRFLMPAMRQLLGV